MLSFVYLLLLKYIRLDCIVLDLLLWYSITCRGSGDVGMYKIISFVCPSFQFVRKSVLGLKKL